jgi:hypothetical protein
MLKPKDFRSKFLEWRDGACEKRLAMYVLRMECNSTWWAKVIREAVGLMKNITTTVSATDNVQICCSNFLAGKNRDINLAKIIASCPHDVGTIMNELMPEPDTSV